MDETILSQLNEPLDHNRIVTFTKGPQQGLKYLEGHDVIKTANRIFGYGNWSYRLVGQPWVIEDGVQGNNATPYQVWAAIVEATVDGCEPFVELGTNTRQGTGSAALEMAIKGAVTDGMKRCLKNYGDQFGLVLYDKDAEYWDLPDAGERWDESYKDRAEPAQRSNTPPPPQTRQQRPPSAPQGQSGVHIPSLFQGLNERHIRLDAVADLIGVALAKGPGDTWNNVAAAIAKWAVDQHWPGDPLEAVWMALDGEEVLG